MLVLGMLCPQANKVPGADVEEERPLVSRWERPCGERPKPL